jgi:hypothetical protein
MNRCHRINFTRHPLALAAATALISLLSAQTQAAITTSGSVGIGPVVVPIGPGDTVVPGTALWVGNGALGSLTVNGGSFLQAARLSFGSTGVGPGNGLISGAGSRVELVGDGASNSQVQRLVVGDFGDGSLTVAAGAVLDTRGNPAPCLVQFHYCDSFVGAAAGSSATLTLTGAGTQALIGSALFVGHPGLAVHALNGYTYGVPGGTVQGRVNVLDGALLSTDRAQIGTRQWDSASTGQEGSFSEVIVRGAGSRWVVTGGQTWDGVTGNTVTLGASLSTALDPRAWANLTIDQGGKLRIEGPTGFFNSLGLTTDRGRTDMTVSGAGSVVEFAADAAVLQVGRRLGSAKLTLQAGGGVTGVWYTSVGRDGSFGEMVVDGAGTVFSSTGVASVAANGSLSNPIMDIGRSGTGVVTVSNGGRIELAATEARPNGPQLSLGRDAASAGSLNIAGAGSVVQLTAQSVLAGGGPGEAFNPFVRVGRDGQGTLNITAGGKLLIDGNAVSTVADSRSTSLLIGGTSDTINGGRGIALVSGAGSEIRMTGNDTFIGVGFGPQSSGQLTVADHAAVSAIGMNVGRSGGVGVLRVDNAALNFSGQQTGGVLAGAFLSIGRSAGIGVAEFANGSVVTLNNMGASGASLNLGGTGPGPLGDGSLTVSGGSQVLIQAAPGLATVSVGRDGSALLRVKGASTINAGDGNFFVGRLGGSDGTVIATGGSAISAGWVGVGRDRTASGSVDGGTGTMILNGATLTADTVVIGTNGFLGGTAGSINAGNVINYGIFSPGNSPGLFTINGNFTAGAGSRLILEVQADGHGGFLTDQVLFGGGGALDLTSLAVEFRFLGETDPNAFQASGSFNIDQFLGLQDANGGITAIDDAAFAQARFTAQADGYTISDFSYTAAGGATFTATAVPEPGAWALMLAGGAAVLGITRRRRRD